MCPKVHGTFIVQSRVLYVGIIPNALESKEVKHFKRDMAKKQMKISHGKIVYKVL